MTVIASPPVPLQQPPDPPGRVLLRGVSWQAYQALHDSLGDSRTHLTYDDGFLEIEVPSKRHEELSRLAAELVQVLLDAVRLDYQPLGSMTWDREDLLKAIEADECYYVRNLAGVHGKSEIDLAVDPPPDLAIEVEVSNSAIDKLGIYAALRVPEVWRIREDASVRILTRNAAGGYDPAAESAAVPRATAALIEGQLKLIPPTGAMIHSAVVRQFRTTLAGGTPTP